MTAAKARLWTGISCVGTLVVGAGLVIYSGATNASPTSSQQTPTEELITLIAVFAGIAALLAPFDVVGGFIIPRHLENQPLSFAQWSGSWFRAVVVQIAFYSLTFFAYLQVGRAIGAAWMIGMFAVFQVTLLAGQELFWRLMTPNRPQGHCGRSGTFFQHRDRRFVGGITGLPGFENVALPGSWRGGLSPQSIRILAERRLAALQSGGRRRGILVAMFWNIACFTTAIVAAGGTIVLVSDLVTIYLWFLILSFVGLLVLPVFNRNSVFALDRFCLRTTDPSMLRTAINELDNLTEQDTSRSAAEESVFQPIPCPERRTQFAATSGQDYVPAWNVARTTLYLSWAFGGPLSRAVHCNIGRPELWAMLPSD